MNNDAASAATLVAFLATIWALGYGAQALVYRTYSGASAARALAALRHAAVITAVLACAVVAVTLLTAWMGAVDESINQALQAVRTQAVVTAFSWLTEVGSMPALVVSIAIISALLIAFKRPILLKAFWLLNLGSQLTVWIAKYAINRPRPDYLTEAVAYTPSFPSAHAALSLAVYGGVALVISTQVSRGLRRYNLCFGFVALALLIGISRPLLSVHYISDVLLGWLIGVFWLLIAARFTIARQETP